MATYIFLYCLLFSYINSQDTKLKSIHVVSNSNYRILHPRGYYQNSNPSAKYITYDPTAYSQNPYSNLPNPSHPYYYPSHSDSNPYHPYYNPYPDYAQKPPIQSQSIPTEPEFVPDPPPIINPPQLPPLINPPQLPPLINPPLPPLINPPPPPLINPPPQVDDYFVIHFTPKSLPPLQTPIHSQCINHPEIPQTMCVERSNCFHTFSLHVLPDQKKTCRLPSGNIGVCCPKEDFGGGILQNDFDDYYEGISIRSSRNADYEKAIQKAEDEFVNWEKKLQKIEVSFNSTPEQFHQDMLRATPEAFIAAREAMILLHANQLLNASDAKYASLSSTKLRKNCRQVPECTLSPYRTFNGVCNNLLYPLWGSTNSGFNRILEPDYADGVQEPRRAKNGSELPSGRYISLNYIEDVNKPDLDVSHMVMAFGQLIAHDLSRVAVFTKPGDKTIECCTPQVLKDPKKLHPACYPIKLDGNDPTYKNHPCIEFVRAAPAQTDDCKLNTRRDPMNQVTHGLDGSFVYGSDEEAANNLRLGIRGQLKTVSLHGHSMLPYRNSSTCGDPKQGIHCFDSGDARVNQQPLILSLHIIFHREHNRIAHYLNLVNPHWNDEMLFQESRKILIAQIQHITFNEFLPLFVDHWTRLTHGILLKASDYTNSYNPHVKPNILCAFQAAAFRVGHSLVQSHLKLFSHGHNYGEMEMKNNYFNPSFLYKEKNNLERIIEGLLIQPAQCTDKHFSKALTLDLFKRPSHPGLDLYAINLQRGRDIGLNGYNDWRAKCELPKATIFSDFNDFIEPQQVKILEKIYDHVDDVDLYTAGVMETPIPGLLVGPTFRCIIANQFQRIKIADRFWYERYNKEENVGFTPNQLAQIRKSTLARILCSNTDVHAIQPLALLQISDTNPPVPCSDAHIPAVDFLPWKER